MLRRLHDITLPHILACAKCGERGEHARAAWTRRIMMAPAANVAGNEMPRREGRRRDNTITSSISADALRRLFIS